VYIQTGDQRAAIRIPENRYFYHRPVRRFRKFYGAPIVLLGGTVSPKSLITIGLIVGSTLGGVVPMLWGDGGLSMSSVFLGGIGGLLGIWGGYRLSRL
jgi:hypothetical protein